MTDPSMIREVGMAQRLMLWAVLASFLAIIPFVFLITLPFLLYCVYKLSKALRLSTTACVLYMIAMFIPIVGLICLLVLNGKATKILKEADIRVGLMGASKADLPPAEPTE